MTSTMPMPLVSIPPPLAQPASTKPNAAASGLMRMGGLLRSGRQVPHSPWNDAGRQLGCAVCGNGLGSTAQNARALLDAAGRLGRSDASWPNGRAPIMPLIGVIGLFFHILAAVIWVGGMFFAHQLLR